MSPDRDCVLECGPDKTCYADTCCGRTTAATTTTTTTADSSQPRETAGPSLRQRGGKCFTPEQPQPSDVLNDPITTAVATTIAFADSLTPVTPCWSVEISDTRA